MTRASDDYIRMHAIDLGVINRLTFGDGVIAGLLLSVAVVLATIGVLCALT